MASSLAAILVFVSVVNAHFKLLSPVGIGFDDDNEGDAPCGSFTPDFNNGTINDWHVGGDFISTLLAHPQASWLYRATLDKTAAGGWIELLPIVQQSGLGVFCESSVAGPADWVGKQGLLSVVADAPDGLLYQCALVNFVSGNGSPNATICSNATGVTATFKDDPALTALLDSNSSSNASSSTGGSSSASSSMPSASSSHNAAPGLVNPDFSFLASLLIVSLMGVLGAALL